MRRLTVYEQNIYTNCLAASARKYAPALRLAPGAGNGGPTWSRTRDLTLIRRAL